MKSLLIVSLVLLLSSFGTAGAVQQSCQGCHPNPLKGLHARLDCEACHPSEKDAAHKVGATGARQACFGCHENEGNILRQTMATRSAEKQLVAQSYGQQDPDFYQNNCSSCHLSNCNDCHGSPHDLRLPDNETCLRCHKGSFVGWDYLGRAPREDSLRYQRGPEAQGDHYLLMRPDVHAERGMSCASCHSMASLAAGKTSAKTCQDCHRPDPAIIEHSISAHLDKLKCISCHGAWAPQEYGTFYLKLTASPAREYFRVRQDPDSNYVKSAYLKLQEPPPLGLDAQGKISPMRPFILYYSAIHEGEPVGEENRQVLAAWQPYAPHTVRRGTVLCDQCHNNPRRFLLEPETQRIYRPDLDGLGLSSFWDRSGQEVIGGRFLSVDRVHKLQQKTPAYTEAYVKKWQLFLKHVDASSNSVPQ